MNHRLSHFLPHFRRALGLLFTALFLFQAISCYSDSPRYAAQFFTAEAENFRRGDFSALARLSENDLRTAQEDANGSLYYGGLLLYLNGQADLAEIALRRAARTGRDPLAREAARLVAYFMTIDYRNNQIQPFLESIVSPREIARDPELFYYQSLAFALEENYAALSKLLDAAGRGDAPPQWRATLRGRVSAAAASFSYMFWRALAANNSAENSAGNSADDLAYRALVSYQTKDMMDSTGVFAQRLYPQLSERTRAVLDAKLALQQSRGPSAGAEQRPRGSNNQSANQPNNQSANQTQTAASGQGASRAADLFMALPPEAFIHPAMTEDLLTALRASSAARAKLSALLDTAYERAASEGRRAAIDLTRANLQYEQNNYAQSLALYRRAFAGGITSAFMSEAERNRGLWRMLFTVIQTDNAEFIAAFEAVVRQSGNPAYFAGVLEEYLALLLRSRQYARLARDAQYLRGVYAGASGAPIRAELSRWFFILRRIKEPSIGSSTAGANEFHGRTAYASDEPFEYLLFTEGLTKEKFIRDWTGATAPAAKPSSAEQPAAVVPSRTADVATFMRGYLQFGLSDYGAEIARENLRVIDDKSLRALLQRLVEEKKYDTSLMLSRAFASLSASFLQSEGDVRLLYPGGFLDATIDKFSSDKKEHALLYALMREESGFIADVVSSARAVGLMQLLPSTAKDIADRIGYGPFDLTDPEDNIALGYNYFKYLLRVVSSPVEVFIAYNGGLGNFWKWEKQFDMSDIMVFADSLPFRETRNYVRKVVSSAVIYGMLYYGIAPADMIAYLSDRAR